MKTFSSWFGIKKCNPSHDFKMDVTCCVCNQRFTVYRGDNVSKEDVLVGLDDTDEYEYKGFFRTRYSRQLCEQVIFWSSHCPNCGHESFLFGESTNKPPIMSEWENTTCDLR